MEGTFDIVKACVGWMWSITHACCKCAVGMGCLKWMTTSMSLQWFVCLGTFMLIQACSQVMSVQSICLCTFLSHCRCRVKEPKAKVGWWPLYFALGWAWRLGQGGGRGWGKQFLCTQRWWNRCGREWGTWIVSGWGAWCQWCVCLEILFPKTSEVIDQSSLLNTGTLLSASPVKICFIPLHPICWWKFLFVDLEGSYRVLITK